MKGENSMKKDKDKTFANGARQLCDLARIFLAGGLALVGISGCARVNVENVNVRALGLPRPQMIYVHDFAVSADAVALDSGLGARALEMAKGTETEDRIKIGKEIARIVSENLVKEIGAQGMPAQLAGAAVVPGPTMSIEGQFVSVDEGSRAKRMVIGFGAGASEIRTLVQVYETVDGGRRLVEDFYTTVKSSRKPGMGPMAGAGAAAGRAASSAAASAGIGIASARSQTVEADAKAAAAEIAKELGKLFVEQGWIPPR
jgi:Domain of unknown function (DUF4410)